MNAFDQHIYQLRKTGILFSGIIFFSTTVFMLISRSDSNLIWNIAALICILFMLASYKLKYLEKNVENFLYLWVGSIVAIAFLDVYSSGLDLINGLIPPTVIYLIGNIDFKKTKYFGLILLIAFIGQCLLSFNYYASLPEEAIVSFLFSAIAIVASFFYVYQKNKSAAILDKQLSVPEDSPQSIIEVGGDLQLTFFNNSTKNLFPEIVSKKSKHSVLHNLDKVLTEIKKSDKNFLTRKIKIASKIYQQKIVYYEKEDITRLYTIDITDLYTKTQSLRKAQDQLEDEQQKLLNLIDDLTEEKDFESVRNKILIENLSEGIIMTDEYGSINYANQAFLDLLGFKESDLLSNDISEVLTAFDLNDKQIPASQLSNNAAITAKESEMKLKLVDKDGNKIPVDIRSAIVKIEDHYKGVVRVVHDITQDVSLAQQKDDFFSIASHELRTPLTVISGNIDIILQGYSDSKLSADDQELLQDTLSASDRLIRMVNDFLNVSRLDQGRLQYHMEEIDPCEIAESVAKELKPLADDKGIDLIYACDKSHKNVTADEGLLKEIIINLAGNSIKFTEKGSVTISNSVENGLVTIRIIDTGVGIEKDQQDKLFGRFQQVMSKTLARQAGGTGLGLYISREFARKMGGDLILEKSEYGKGSTFRLTLPAVEPSAVIKKDTIEDKDVEEKPKKTKSNKNKKSKKSLKSKKKNIEDE